MKPLKQKTPYKWVGTRPVRHDGLDKVTGKARFAADMLMPRMIYGHVLRSPYAHARILSIDTSAAETMPGVGAIITAADFPEPDPKDFVSRNLMARDKVLYEGQVVAAVAANTRRQAKAAAERIRVEYEELPYVLNVDEAMAEDAPLLHDNLMTQGVDPVSTKASNISKRTLYERGDLEAGFAEADVVIEREFTTKVVYQGYIEPHAAVADTDKDDRATIWCSTQGAFWGSLSYGEDAGLADVSDQSVACRNWGRIRRKNPHLSRGTRFPSQRAISGNF